MSIYNLLVIIFAASEIGLFLSKRSKSDAVKSQADKKSMLYLWIAIPVSLTASGFISGYGIFMFQNIELVEKIGIAIALIGFIIRWTAIFQLGRMFTVDVSISTTHVLKNSGLYKIVRHPSYLGLMLIILGIITSQGSVLALILSFIIVFWAMNYRMIVEENALTSEFGQQYIDYKKRVKRILPGIY